MEDTVFSIGDEVIRHYKSQYGEGDDTPTVVYDFEEGCLKCIHIQNGRVISSCYPKEQYRKTGRHFSELSELFRKMQQTKE